MPRYFDAIRQLGVNPEAVEDVFSGVDFGVFVDHPEHGCIYANAELLRMFGMTWEEFRGFGWARVVLPTDMEMLREAIERYEHEKATIEVQYRIRVSDGSIRTIGVFGRAVLDEQGEQRGSVIITREVTAARAEADRTAHAQKLEVIGRLAGRIAHDFNNVMTPIMCAASLLEREALSDKGKEFLAGILQGTEHAAAITRQLLGLSGLQVQVRRVCVPDDEIGQLRTLLGQMLGEPVTLQLELDAPNLQIGLPSSELGQIVINLALNSRDAMDGAGLITIATRGDADTVTLSVRDEGDGIPPEVQEQMFDPFFTTKSPDRGTGLGLSTVRDLLRRAGGTVDVRSVPGSGTEISLTFPCLGASIQTDQEPESGGDEQAPVQILVVDDNSAIRQTLAYVLALRGHGVKTSGTIKRALALTEEQHFDVLVTDVLLPDGAGPELVEAVRARQPDIRVIYMSGFAGLSHAQVDLDAPLTLFLQKPFHPNELAGTVAEVLQMASP